MGNLRAAGALRAQWTRLELAAIGCNLFAFSVVNYWIYAARSEYFTLHPLEAAAQPPTISKAITDPAIGAPFQFWICLSALFLALGVTPIAALYFRAGRRLPAACAPTAGILRRFSLLLLLSQFAACAGMVVLSTWRGPDHAEGHMAGSYLFFAAQALTVLSVGIMCGAIARDAEAGRTLRRFSLIHPGLCRVRSAFAFGAVVSAVLFLALFLVKGVEFEFGYALLYQLYVWLEPFTISCFLALLASYSFELAFACGAFRAPPRLLGAASPMPD